MPSPPGKKLCVCKNAGCFFETDVDPKTNERVRGQFISQSLWRNHQRSQKMADNDACYDSVFNTAILRTMAPTEKIAHSVSSEAEEPTEASRSSTSQGLADAAQSSSGENLETKWPEDVIDRMTDDLIHLSNLIDQKIRLFSPPRVSLEFVTQPEKNTPYVSQVTTSHPVNTGCHALEPRHAANTALIGFEASLIDVLEALNAVNCCDVQELLEKKSSQVNRVLEMLRRIDDIKKGAWEQTRIGKRGSRAAVRPSEKLNEESDPLVIDMDRIRMKNLSAVDQVPLICVFIVTVLHFLCRLSRDKCNFILVALRYLLDKTLGASHSGNEYLTKKTLDSVPVDLRTAMSDLNLEPTYTPYACCPGCCALYLIGPPDQGSSFPEFCTNKEFPSSDVCGTPLRTSRFIRGKEYSYPTRTFLYQDFPSWLARLVSREGMEDLMDRPLASVNSKPRDTYRDIWDSPIVREFLGPDNLPFFRYQGPEARLLFSFSYDNFNPFHNKQAGKKVDVGAIFMVCLNLPPTLRFRFENMYLAGIVNGPKKPSLTQINHYVRPLITHLDIFYRSGYFLTSTPLYSEGRLSRGAVIPLICDLLAARQVGGYGAPTSTHFCTFCGMLLQSIDDVDPANWPHVLTCADHRSAAKSWLDATSPKEREEIFKEFGVRWSEFLRLPYWKPSLFTVFDTMHGWFLNDFENHIRVIWGVSEDKPSGDGLFVGKRPHGPLPTPAERLSALRALKDGRESTLDKVRRPVLYQLCEDKGLRRGMKCGPMRLALKKFYSTQKSRFIHADIEAARKGVADHELEPSQSGADAALDSSRSRLTNVTNTTKSTAEKWLSQRKKSILEQLCYEWHIETSTRSTRAVMAKALVVKQLANPRILQVRKSLQTEGAAVLGSDVVQEINADISRTVIPSWVPTGPRRFGSSDHGKLKADEWRITGLVRLAITLPRVWGPRGGRFRLMLDNFMLLVRAIIVGSALEVVARPSEDNGATQSTEDMYCEAYQAYLQGIVDLYPTATVKPNMHISYHVGRLLSLFGPVHAWRCWVFERFNGIIQNLPTNMRFGELEQTLMRSFCMGATLRAFMHHPNVPEALKGLADAFESAFFSDAQGTLLNDFLGVTSDTRDTIPSEPNVSFSQLRLDLRVCSLLVDCLNSRYKSTANPRPYISSHLRIPGSTPINPTASSFTKFRQGGILYSRARPTNAAWVPEERFSPHPDSHILIRVEGESRPQPCIILDIFSHKHSLPGSKKQVTDMFLIVKRYLALASKDEPLDNWRNYSIGGGSLYYDELREESEVVFASSLVSHFAKTPYKATELPGLDRPSIHVLPLDWHHIQLLK